MREMRTERGEMGEWGKMGEREGERERGGAERERDTGQHRKRSVRSRRHWV